MYSLLTKVLEKEAELGLYREKLAKIIKFDKLRPEGEAVESNKTKLRTVEAVTNAEAAYECSSDSR